MKKMTFEQTRKKRRTGRITGLITATMLAFAELASVVSVPVEAYAQEAQIQETVDEAGQPSDQLVSELSYTENVLPAEVSDVSGTDVLFADYVSDGTDEAVTDGSGTDTTTDTLPSDSASADAKEAGPDNKADTAGITDEITAEQIETEEIVEDTQDTQDSVEEEAYVYPDQTSWHITFNVISEGQIISRTVNNTLNADTAVENAVAVNVLSQVWELSQPNAIEGWMVSVNGHPETDANKFLYADFTSKKTGADYLLKPKMDYTFTSCSTRYVGDNLEVLTIPAVYYNGRSHIDYVKGQTSGVPKGSVADVELYVMYQGDTILRNGTDYKTTFKNNKNASMKMLEDGTYERLPLSDKKRPQVTITGLGDFAGFTATVYFDILPYNFGELPSRTYTIVGGMYWIYHGQTTARFYGMQSSYKLKNGKLDGKIDSTVKIRDYDTNTDITLKNGKDYVLRCYKYEYGRWIYHEKVDEEGRWLCTARGTGNYCGTVFGQQWNEANTVFKDGSDGGAIYPTVYDYTDDEVPVGQFKVADENLDISKAKVTIKHPVRPYTHGKKYGVEDFGLVVKLGSYTLAPGADYYVVFEGGKYTHIEGKDLSNGVYQTSYPYADTFQDEVWMADTYKMEIHAANGNLMGYYGTLTPKKTVTVKGVKIQSKWVQLESASKVWDSLYADNAKFRESSDRKIYPDGNLDYLLSDHATDNGSKRTYQYLLSMADGFSKDYLEGQWDYKVAVFNEYARETGTYPTSIVPVGPGVDHSSEISVDFTIKPLAMKQAVKQNFIKVYATKGTYNAGGALPEDLKILYNKKMNTVTMHYNKETFTVTDGSGFKTNVTLTVTNNTKPGTAYINISGDGSPFSGSATKVAKFSVYPVDVGPGPIHVLGDEDYQVVYGRKTDSVKVDDTHPVGTFYAVYNPMEREKKFKARAQVDLYQSYYANYTEYKNGRASLKKLSANQFYPSSTGDANGLYTITLTKNSGNPPEKSGLNFLAGAVLDKKYDTYETEATITEVVVSYDGTEYTLPKDVKALKIPYRGGQVRFDSVKSVTVKTKDGLASLGPDNFSVVYGDNITAGKNKGTITVTLKRNAVSYLYGATKTFKFNIEPAGNVVM